MADEIVVVEPDPGWPARYLAVRRELVDAAGDLLLEVEHIGSTAVPGLAAKPVIDVLAAIRSDDDIAALAERLESVGYQHRPRNMVDADAAYFRRFDASGARTEHIHVVLADEWAGDVRRTFRDLLRTGPDLVAAYGRLKAELAQRHTDDRVAYTDAKTDFVEAALRSGPDSGP